MKPKRSKPYWNVQDENVFHVHPKHLRDGILIFLINLLVLSTLIATAVWVQNLAE